MEIRNATLAQIGAALDEANEHFKGNLEFRDITPLNKKGTGYRVTLRVKSSRGPGARLGQQVNHNGNRRHLPCACWHAYGKFIDALFSEAPDARLITSGQRYTRDNWSWVDRNIGSMMSPLYYSEACECQ